MGRQGGLGVPFGDRGERGQGAGGQGENIIYIIVLLYEFYI